MAWHGLCQMINALPTCTANCHAGRTQMFTVYGGDLGSLIFVRSRHVSTQVLSSRLLLWSSEHSWCNTTVHCQTAVSVFSAHTLIFPTVSHHHSGLSKCWSSFIDLLTSRRMWWQVWKSWELTNVEHKQFQLLPSPQNQGQIAGPLFQIHNLALFWSWVTSCGSFIKWNWSLTLFRR